jgi:hypothetical protein
MYITFSNTLSYKCLSYRDKQAAELVLVAHTCNPGYLGGSQFKASLGK